MYALRESMPMSVPANTSAPQALESDIVMELVDAASEVVVPAMRAVFKEGEVSAFKLSVTDELGGSVAVSLTARGERFDDYVVQGVTPQTSVAEWRERLRSNLVDFVAESRFGWGENRDAH